MNEYKGWRYSARIKRQEDTTECYLSFYKQMEDRDWYDEVRFDSHERKRGKRTELPHFHVKLHSNPKLPAEANSDLVKIIDDIIPQLLEVTEK